MSVHLAFLCVKGLCAPLKFKLLSSSRQQHVPFQPIIQYCMGIQGFSIMVKNDRDYFLQDMATLSQLIEVQDIG